jgi:hypothetical protein
VILKELEEESVTKWQREWTNSKKRENYTRLLSGGQGETKYENKFDTKLDSNGYRPRENKLIPTPF